MNIIKNWNKFTKLRSSDLDRINLALKQAMDMGCKPLAIDAEHNGLSVSVAIRAEIDELPGARSHKVFVRHDASDEVRIRITVHEVGLRQLRHARLLTTNVAAVTLTRLDGGFCLGKATTSVAPSL